jgi:hypothetical protein
MGVLALLDGNSGNTLYTVFRRIIIKRGGTLLKAAPLLIIMMKEF